MARPKVEEEALHSYSTMRDTANGKFDPGLLAPMMQRKIRHEREGKEVAEIQPLAKASRLLAMDYEKFHLLTKEIQQKFPTHLPEDCQETQNLIREMESGIVSKETEMSFRQAVYDKAMEDMESFVWNPLPLPFDCVFLAFHNRNPQAARNNENVRMMTAHGMEANLQVVMGYLLTKNSVYEFAFEVSTQNVACGFVPLVYEGVLSGVNKSAHLTDLRAIRAVFDSVQQTGITRISKAGLEGKKLTKLGKHYSHVPRDYHLITVQDGIRYEEPEPDYDEIDIGSHSTQGYCYDVIGHQATRILRGELPLDEKLEKYLLRDSRRVVIRSKDDLTDDLTHLLLKRGIFYRENEWISILTFPVKPHQRNKDKPYVPATYSLNKVDMRTEEA